MKPDFHCLHCKKSVRYDDDRGEWVHVRVHNGTVTFGDASCGTNAIPVVSEQA